MAKTDDDWYPGDGATERLMYGNIEAKINNYAAKYPVLTFALLAQVHAACQTFIEAYDKIEYNRATARHATIGLLIWFRASRVINPRPRRPFLCRSLCPPRRLPASRSFCAIFARS